MNSNEYMYHVIEKETLSQYRFCEAFITPEKEYEDELQIKFELP